MAADEGSCGSGLVGLLQDVKFLGVNWRTLSAGPGQFQPWVVSVLSGSGVYSMVQERRLGGPHPQIQTSSFLCKMGRPGSHFLGLSGRALSEPRLCWLLNPLSNSSTQRLLVER